MTADNQSGLVCEGLAERRGFRRLFASLSFSVGPGELLEITGDNGTGKSTLLHCLTGLRRAESGLIRWQGEDICRSPRFSVDLRYVGHRVGVKLALTARENLSMSCALAGSEWHDLSAALRIFGLDRSADIPCRRLSAGQRRRVALARLVASPGRLWILDEPYSALDQAGQRLVSEQIRRFCSDGGVVVMTTHHVQRIDSVQTRQLALT